MINGKLQQMEVDTGAAVSITSKQTQNRLLLNVTLSAPAIFRCTYTSETLSVLDKMKDTMH